MSAAVTVETLALHGLAPGQQEAVLAAFEVELRRLAATASWQADAQIGRLRIGPVQQGATPAITGRAIAGAVMRALSTQAGRR